MYVLLLIFLLLILLISYIQFSINSVLSYADDYYDDNGFFVAPEEKFFNPRDYGGESSLSSEEGNHSENFQSEDELYNRNSEKLIAPINFTEFNFALAGDWGCTKNTKKTVDLIQTHEPELVFSLGDTSYGTDIKCWKDIVKPISDRIKAVIGNHDVMSPFLLNQHLNEFGLSKPYYSFDYNNIHFLMMDSESSYFPGADPHFSDLENTEQYQFVKNDLSHVSKNPSIKWIIVMSHRQFYSSLCGEHDSCEPIKKLRDAYHPLFEKYGVDLVFSGHAHNYERTYPLFYNEMNSSEPIIEEKESKTDYNFPKGMFQIIVGTGGIDFDTFSNQEPFIVYQQDSKYGFLNIDVIDQGNTLIGRYYANNGEILDEFKIRK
ncbi:MAG TPA: metallophosphoesterase [Nitrososphaeraceae archaeon]|nr:metallophosphoesterase [Nitrososphaeraceae archaeon]